MVSTLSNYDFKYTQSTLSKFDIIGSYFVNLYYNEFYTKANTLRINGTYENVTDAYKNILSSYLDYIKKPEFFKQIVKGIHAYCISTTKYTTMTHKECIDFMISEFIPQKLWSSIRENQKNKLFHESLNNSITIFTADIISNHLIMIIDNHSHSENITILQDLFLKVILLEKDKVYSKFLNPNNNNTISVELFKTKLMELVNEKKELTIENTQFKKNIEILKQLLEKNSNIIIELQKKNKELLLNNENIKNQYNVINKKNIELETIISNFKSNNIHKTETNLSSNINQSNSTKQIHNLDNKIADNKIVEKLIAEKQIVEKQIIENKLVENKIIEKKKTNNIKKIKDIKTKDKYSKLLSESDSESDDNSDENSDDNSESNYTPELKKKSKINIKNNANINNNELEFDNDDDFYT
jgi:hypothetical protein